MDVISATPITLHGALLNGRVQDSFLNRASLWDLKLRLFPFNSVANLKSVVGWKTRNPLIQ